MKKQGTEISDQRTQPVEQLLRAAVPRIEEDAEPIQDLWPAMLRRMEQKPNAPPWFDWALAGGVAVFAMAFPAAIPVFLYYL